MVPSIVEFPLNKEPKHRLCAQANVTLASLSAFMEPKRSLSKRVLGHIKIQRKLRYQLHGH